MCVCAIYSSAVYYVLLLFCFHLHTCISNLSLNLPLNKTKVLFVKLVVVQSSRESVPCYVWLVQVSEEQEARDAILFKS